MKTCPPKKKPGSRQAQLANLQISNYSMFSGAEGTRTLDLLRDRQAL